MTLMLISQCNNKEREKTNIKKLCGQLDANPYCTKGYMDLQYTSAFNYATKINTNNRKNIMHAICNKR